MARIYRAVLKSDGRSYIGQTIRPLSQRMSAHLRDAKNGSHYLFHQAIREHGSDAFEWIVLAEGLDEEELQSAEKFFVAFWRSNEPQHGFNMTAGGQNGGPNQRAAVRQASEERWALMTPDERTRVMKGRWAIRRKNGNADLSGTKNPFFGKLHTDETRLKISKRGRGRKTSEEAKRRLSEAAKRDWVKRRAS